MSYQMEELWMLYLFFVIVGLVFLIMNPMMLVALVGVVYLLVAPVAIYGFWVDGEHFASITMGLVWLMLASMVAKAD